MASINDIANAFSSYPPLRTNKYEVYINFPSASSQGFVGPVWATSVNLPGRSLSTVERRTFGPQRDMPYERLFSGDLEVTFILNKGAPLRTYFEEWMDLIIDPTTNRIKNSRQDYLGELEIDLLSDDNDVEYSITVEEVFPKSIGPVPLSYRSENEIAEQQISFSFRNYRQRNASDDGGGI